MDRRETAFRLKQELANVWMNLRKPAPVLDAATPLPGLPAPQCIAETVKASLHAAQIEDLANRVLNGEPELLEAPVPTGSRVRWRRDYANDIESPLRYFRRIRYLDFNAVGEHRIIWELNRHQHLVCLAQAHVLTGKDDYTAELWRQLESWLADNRFLQGINWTSALEVAFRSLSWIWIWHLTGGSMPADLRSRFLIELYRHGCFLEHNLSVYYSPNTHLLGESVVLHALGRLFPDWPRSTQWRDAGAAIVRAQLSQQVRQDGCHFEQSTYYHVYALDFFLLHAALITPDAEYLSTVERMAAFLVAVMGPARLLPLLGDDDGGRVFHPYGARNGFGRATLATSAALLGRAYADSEPEDFYVQAVWWFGPSVLDRVRVRVERPGNVLFSDAGLAVIHDGSAHVIVDCGPFGPWSGGHSHSDTLSLIVSDGPREVLIDPGTYRYSDPVWRDRFRGSAAHNAVRIAGKDQAKALNPFRWGQKPVTRIQQWSPELQSITGSCSYEGFLHVRKVRLVEGILLILDEIEGPPGTWLVEQFWHPGEDIMVDPSGGIRIGDARLCWENLNATAEIGYGGEYGWRSECFGQKRVAPVIRIHRDVSLPVRFASVLELRSDFQPVRVRVAGGNAVLYSRGEKEVVVTFAPA